MPFCASCSAATVQLTSAAMTFDRNGATPYVDSLATSGSLEDAQDLSRRFMFFVGVVFSRTATSALSIRETSSSTSKTLLSQKGFGAEVEDAAMATNG